MNQNHLPLHWPRIKLGVPFPTNNFPGQTINRNFRDWILKKNAGHHNRFNEEQLQWLRMIKDYIASSFHIEKDDFDLNPFNAHGGLGKMWQLFGEETEQIIEEMNLNLVA